MSVRPGHKFSAERNKKISQSKLGKKLSEAHCKSISKSLIGSKRRWKGGRKLHQNGYWRVYVGRKNGEADYKFEHRLAVERFLGRQLLSTERVHHINGIKTDNRIENLMLLQNQGEHEKLHNSLVKWRKRRAADAASTA